MTVIVLRSNLSTDGFSSLLVFESIHLFPAKALINS